MQSHIPPPQAIETPESIQYLQALRFLYVEAMRMKQNRIANVLEKALSDIARILKDKEMIREDDPLLFEVLFLKGFRRLEHFEKIDLLKLLEEDERRETH